MRAEPTFLAAEDDYLQAHFAWVLCLLRAQPAWRLDDATRERREATLGLWSAVGLRGTRPRSAACCPCSSTTAASAGAGSVAPLLAALFLLSIRRRRTFTRGPNS